MLIEIGQVEAIFRYPVKSIGGERRASAPGIKPLARFVAYSYAGCLPEEMGVGPAYAIPKALKLAGLTLDQIDLIELNEAFAAQSLAVIKTLGLDMAKVNVNGGAIALGHPLGCTDATDGQPARGNASPPCEIRHGDDVHRRAWGPRAFFRI